MIRILEHNEFRLNFLKKIDEIAVQQDNVVNGHPVNSKSRLDRNKLSSFVRKNNAVLKLLPD